METRKYLKKRLRELFFISVKNDIEKWTGYSDYYSPTYDNNYYLVIDNDEHMLRISNNDNKKKISKFRYGIFIIDFKVWYYVLKLKKHFKQKEEDLKNSRDINFFKNSIYVIEKTYVKEVRKEKLENLK